MTEGVNEEVTKAGVLDAVSKSRLVRPILGRVTKRCRACGDRRLNVALELIAGTRLKSCFLCRFVAKLIRRVISAGADTFGTDLDSIITGLGNPIFRKSLSSVISGLVKFGARTPFVPGSPFQVVWNITRACNLRCKHCYESAGERTADEMSTNDALECIDKLADAGVVFLAFSGGEPTLRPDILELIKSATRKGMYVAVATNGYTFSRLERVKRFKRAGLKFVQISLDGANSQTHDSFRGVSGAFERAIQGIKNCVAEGLFVEIAMTATHHNLVELHDTIELGRKLRAKWFMVYNFVPTGRGLDILDSDLTPDERENMLQKILDMISSKDPEGMEVLTTAPQLGRLARKAACSLCTPSSLNADNQVYPTHFFNARLPFQMKELSEFIGGCGAGRFYVAIEPNGDIYPCVFFPHIPEVRIGNILEDDFHDLWVNSDILSDLRNKDLLKGACGSCQQRNVCGGCRARALGYFNDYLGPDPGCINNRDAWQGLFPIRTRKPSLQLVVQGQSKAAPDIS
ncbi:MAG: radical SAM protein [Promethearchaeota archaeon]